MFSEKERSLGDGMEQPDVVKSDQHFPLIKEKIHVHVGQKNPVKKKLVPREPYKAAVCPNVESFLVNNKVIIKPPMLREKHILFPLYNEPPSSATKDSNPPLLKILRPINGEGEIVEEKTETCCQECVQEKGALREELEYLQEQYKDLQQQFQVQTQVNAEVKKLLVASLGEDMQERVQFLTEDKAKLAQNIDSYSQKIQDDHEELERLEIQSDVWRSKYLASSVMVDELAGWKAKLVRRYEDALEAIQGLLQEHQEMKSNMITTQRKLRSLRDSFDPMASQHSKDTALSCSLLSLSKVNRKLSEDLSSRLLGSLGYQSQEPRWDMSNLWTPAELRAKEVISSKDSLHPVVHPKPTKEEKCRLHSKKCHHLKRPPNSVNGCRHCSGEVHLI